MDASHVREVFPEIAEIEDEALRAAVVEAWATAMAETDTDDLHSVQWLPSEMARLGLEDEPLVDHVRDVAAGAVGLAEVLLDRRDTAVDVDTVLAGALVHDASKLYEFDGMDETPVGDLLGHPHYGVHVAAAAGLPVEIAHIVLSHSDMSAVDPATIEAAVVQHADRVAAAAIRCEGVEDLREV